MKWMDCKSDFLLIRSDGQLFLFNPDQKTCNKPLKDATDCTKFVLFESSNEELQLALLCSKSVLLVHIQSNQAFVPKQILSLDEIPIGIAASKSSILIQYPKDIERIMILPGSGFQVDRVRISSRRNLIYVEELEVFSFLMDNIAYFLPEKGQFDINSFKIKWSVPPRRLVVVDPYIIGLSDKGVEMHHYYKPHAVMQFEETLSSVIITSATSEYVGQTKEITDTMPGLYTIVQRAGKTVVCKFDQASLEEQSAWFVKANQFKLALNTCDTFIRRKYKKSVTAEEYIAIQRERGYHLFVVEKNYKKAKKILEKYNAPPEEVILLFAELLHKANVEKLMEMFDIDYKSSVCYYCWYSVDDAVVPTIRMKELTKQLKVFLLFFIDKRKQIAGKVQNVKKELISASTGIKLDTVSESKLERLSFLKMLYEMVFFHGCLVLLICKDPDASLVLKEFKAMLAEENSLPSSVCEDLILKYEQFSLLFQFLISKKLFSKIFVYLKEFYKTSRKPYDNFAGDIKTYWLSEVAKNAQEISALVEESEFLKNIQWLIDTGNLLTFLDCLKIKKKNALYSSSLIRFILEKAGLNLAILHLEYLVYKTQPIPVPIPTLLASFYIQAIEDRTRTISSCKGEKQISLEEINNDTEIIGIRNRLGAFLENVKGYDLDSIAKEIPAYLIKERGILMVRQGKFTEGFYELIIEANLPLLAIRIGEECYQQRNDIAVIMSLLKILLGSYRAGNFLRLATTLFERYYDVLNSMEVISILPNEIEVERISQSLGRIIEKEISVENTLQVQKNCQDYKLLELKCSEWKLKEKYRKIEGNETCSKCKEAMGNIDALFISLDGLIWHYRCGV